MLGVAGDELYNYAVSGAKSGRDNIIYSPRKYGQHWQLDRFEAEHGEVLT